MIPDAARKLKWKIVSRLRHSELLAMLWRGLMWRTTVIAVTGSVGKTTCRELLHQILADQAFTYKTPNNQNDAHSVPGVLLGLRPWHRFAVIELAANGPGTLGPLAKMVRPDIAIVTKVANTHMMHYSDTDAVALEKSQLLRFLKRRGVAVLNGDDSRVAAMATRPGQLRIDFGLDSARMVSARSCSGRWPQRLQLTVKSRQGTQAVQTQLIGEHWANSILAAFAVAEHCGVKATDIAASVAKVAPFRGRMQPIALPNGVTAISDENASQDVFQAMVAVAANADARRKLLVLGVLNDSHLNSTGAQRKFAAKIVAQAFDVVIFHGMSARTARSAAIAAGMAPDSVFSTDSMAQIHTILNAELQRGDLLFVKGRNQLHLSRLIYLQVGNIGCLKETCEIRSDCVACSALQPDFDLAAIRSAPVS